VGNARKFGMDYAVAKYYKRSNFKKKHYILMADADTKPPINWIETVASRFSKYKCAALAGTHGADVKIDQTIYKHTGIIDFFNKIPTLIEYLQSNNMCLVKMNGQNSAFEVVAYCLGGGMNQPKDIINDNIVVEGTSALAHEIEKLGLLIKPMRIRTISNKRRQLSEILFNQQMYISQKEKQRIIAVRNSESDLLDHVLLKANTNSLHLYQNTILKDVLNSILIYPLFKNIIPRGIMKRILTTKQYVSMINELEHESPNDSLSLEFVEKWASSIADSIYKKLRKQIYHYRHLVLFIFYPIHNQGHVLSRHSHYSFIENIIIFINQLTD
jgi:hypothetical protein